MTPEVKQHIEQVSTQMEKAIQHLEFELSKIRAGKATPAMLEGIVVEYYGSPTALNQVASVSAPDARSLTIQPWEKQMLGPIEKAIFAANLGFTPQNDGILIRINIPPQTEERRRDLVKQAKAEAEHAKVGIRNVRRDANEVIKKMVKDGMEEDIAKDAEAKIQQLTDSYIAKADKHLETKEKEIMTV
ncbi:MAG: ribosome recycling factor [Flavobacteriales bacterium]